jgi:membrane protease YdiL (CAAX protease family)
MSTDARQKELPAFLLAVLLSFCPWAAVYAGLYFYRSAPLAFVFYHIFCFIGGLLLRSPGLPKLDPPSALRRRILIAVILVANLGAATLYSLIGSLLFDRPHVLRQMETSGLPPTTYFWLFPYFAIVNPLAEEFFWRGGVYAAFRRYLRHWWEAALLASFFFGAWHWLVVRLFVISWLAILSTLTIAIVGFLLTIVYERTRRLPYPIALHALAGDMPLLVVLYLMQYHFSVITSSN